MTDLLPLDAAILPAGIRARFIEGVHGLRVHLLEAGQEDPDRPCLLLLHGFSELASSWRKLMPALAMAGYYIVAPGSARLWAHGLGAGHGSRAD